MPGFSTSAKASVEPHLPIAVQKQMRRQPNISGVRKQLVAAKHPAKGRSATQIGALTQRADVRASFSTRGRFRR